MWDEAKQTKANSEGWRLVTTVNNRDNHPFWDIASHGPRYATDQAATLAVIDAAKRGGALHQHALKLVTQSRVRPTKEKK